MELTEIGPGGWWYTIFSCKNESIFSFFSCWCKVFVVWFLFSGKWFDIFGKIVGLFLSSSFLRYIDTPLSMLPPFWNKHLKSKLILYCPSAAYEHACNPLSKLFATQKPLRNHTIGPGGIPYVSSRRSCDLQPRRDNEYQLSISADLCFLNAGSGWTDITFEQTQEASSQSSENYAKRLQGCHGMYKWYQTLCMSSGKCESFPHRLRLRVKTP